MESFTVFINVFHLHKLNYHFFYDTSVSFPYCKWPLQQFGSDLYSRARPLSEFISGPVYQILLSVEL